jgi:universal stress protein A
MKTTIAKPGRGTRPANAGPGKTALKAGRGARTSVGATADLSPSFGRLDSILVPIDFSATSRKALLYAVQLAERFGGKITIVSVMEPIAAPEFAAVALLADNDAAKRTTKAKLDHLVQEMKIPERLIEKTLVRHGTPFAEITDAARTLKVDLIVLTTHGYTGLKHVFLGSTAERVVRHAPCPVLTVRDKAR